MKEFAGTYKFEKDDGKFEDICKALGIGFLTRKLAVQMSPTVKFYLEGDDTFVIETIITFRVSVMKFKLNTEFDETRMNGSTVKTSITREGNKLIQKQGGNPPLEIIREFTGDKMIATWKCEGIVNVREYKKQ